MSIDPIRIEYLDYEDAGDYRQYRLALRSQERTAQVGVRIPVAAFATNRVLLQDGPDVSYQQLLRKASTGEVPSDNLIIVGGAELTAYREAHTPAPRRFATPKSPPKRAPMTRTPLPDKRPKLPVAAAAPPVEAEQGFEAGQRVSHAIFGPGVTMASSGGHTTVQFDGHGVKSFITSLLELETLSAPHEWEAGPRGKNRPRDVDPDNTASGKPRA